MSIQAILAGAGTISTISQSLGSLGGLFGGGDKPNIANKLSKRLGCNILQSSAGQARALVDQGINPCTMQPIPGGRQTVQVPTDFGPVQPRPSAGPGGPRMSMSRRDIVPAISAAGSAIGRAISGNVVYTSTGRISSIFMGNRRITRRDAAALLRRIGDIATGAAIMGISLQDAADIVITSSKRRRRGITAAQVRNARRTACMVSRLARDLGVKPAPARRRTTCR